MENLNKEVKWKKLDSERNHKFFFSFMVRCERTPQSIKQIKFIYRQTLHLNGNKFSL